MCKIHTDCEVIRWIVVFWVRCASARTEWLKIAISVNLFDRLNSSQLNFVPNFSIKLKSVTKSNQSGEHFRYSSNLMPVLLLEFFMNIRLNEVKAVNNSSVGSFLPYTNKKSTKNLVGKVLVCAKFYSTRKQRFWCKNCVILASWIAIRFIERSHSLTSGFRI